MTWLNARDLYRDLGKWDEREPFTDWFTLRIKNEYKEGEDWKVIPKKGGDSHDPDARSTRLVGPVDVTSPPPNGELEFLITQAVADQIARDDAGPPVERMGYYTKSAEFRRINWNQRLSEQTHAITGDEE